MNGFPPEPILGLAEAKPVGENDTNKKLNEVSISRRLHGLTPAKIDGTGYLTIKQIFTFGVYLSVLSDSFPSSANLAGFFDEPYIIAFENPPDWRAH
jgi:hypothetical protein